jgi:hypothetical protein
MPLEFREFRIIEHSFVGCTILYVFEKYEDKSDFNLWMQVAKLICYLTF